MPVTNKQTAREIFARVLDRIQVERVLARKLRREGARLWIKQEAIDLKPFQNVIVVSFGKAAAGMARAVDPLVRDHFSAGIVVTSAPIEPPLLGYRQIVGGHPYPNEQSVAAAEAIVKLLSESDEHTLVLLLISGGGSALVEKPIEPIPFGELVETYRVLVTSGLNIEEMNIIRKHLSAVKGGRLAAAAHPARVVTLLISDVPPAALATIASGPSLPDQSTVADCYRIARARGLLEKFPERVCQLFLQDKLSETPKPGHAVFARSKHFVLLSSQDAREAAVEVARELGFVPAVDNSVDDWPLAQAAEQLLRRAGDLAAENVGRALCLVSAGELACPVTGGGQGGRNQAFVLYCVPRIAERRIVVLSAGTDGIDGNSPAAGAVADGETLMRAQSAGLDWQEYFDSSDSYHFFKSLGDTIETGPTGNNVRDLRLLLVEGT